MRLLYLLIILCLLPYVILVFFVFPSLDDLSIPLNIRELGTSRFELFTSLMQHWNGRYTSNFLAVVSPLTFGSLFGYRLALMLQLPALYFALYYFLLRLLRHDAHSVFSRDRIHLLSASLLLIYLNLLPDITETIYWLSGAKVYTWALFVQLFVLGLMVSAEIKPGSGKAILLAVLIFILCGFNEIVLAINVFIAYGYLVWPLILKALRKHADTGKVMLSEKKILQKPIPSATENTPLEKEQTYALLPAKSFSLHRILPFLVVMVSSIIVLASPGNEGRLWHFPEGGQIDSTIRIAAISSAKLAGVMMQSMPLVLTGFLLFPHLKASLLPAFLRPLAGWNPALVMMAALLFFFGAMAVPAWAMGINPPMRIYNFLGLYFIGFFFWFLFSLRHWLQARSIPVHAAFTGAGKWIVICLIFLAMAGDFHKEPGPDGAFTYRGNMARVVSDLVLRAGPYKRTMQEREAIIIHQMAIGNYHVIVPPLYNPPTSILYLDITCDPGYWINLLQARMYGIEKLSVESKVRQ